VRGGTRANLIEDNQEQRGLIERSENNLEVRDQDFPISWKLKQEISLTGPHTKIKVFKIKKMGD